LRLVVLEASTFSSPDTTAADRLYDSLGVTSSDVWLLLQVGVVT